MHTLNKQITQVVQVVGFRTELDGGFLSLETLLHFNLVLEQEDLLVALARQSGVVFLDLLGHFVLALAGRNQVYYVLL